MTRAMPFINDAVTKRKYIDNEDGTATIIQQQNCDSVLERNKALYNHNDGYTPSRDMRRVASIPLELVYQWLAEEGWNAFDPHCSDKLKQKLNDPQYLYLRTAPGRL